MSATAGRHRLVGRARGRRLMAAGAVGLATITSAIGLTATSASAALGSYTVTVAPSSAIETTTNTFTVTFTTQNVPSNADLLHGVSVTFPAGFSGVSAPAHATGDDGTWNVSVSGNKVSLTSTSALGLFPGQKVVVPVTATAPGSTGTQQLATTGTGTLGDAFSDNSSPANEQIAINAPPTGVYSAAVSPTSVTASTAGTFTVLFTAISDPTGADLMKSASVTFPAAFTGLSVPASVTGTDGSWSVSRSGSTVTLTSGTAGLPTNGTVAVPVTATAPSTVGTYALSTSAASTLGDPFTTSSSPTIAVGTATCSSTQTCDTTPIGSATNTQVEVVTTPTPNSTNDVVDLSVGGPNTLPCAPNNPAYNGQPYTYTTTDTSRSVGVTFRLDKSLVQQNPNNGTAHYSMCYEGKHPFLTKQGGTSAQDPTTGLYYGDLATCAATANVVPCITSQSKDKAGDLVIQFNGDPGEPSGITH